MCVYIYICIYTHIYRDNPTHRVKTRARPQYCVLGLSSPLLFQSKLKLETVCGSFFI